MKAYVGCDRWADYLPEFDVQVRGLSLHCIVSEAHGRLVLDGLSIARGDRPIGIDDLKSLPLVSLIQHAQTTAVSLYGLTPVEQATVAYRYAMLFGLPPTAAVAGRLGVSHDVAAKRVQAARRAGFLPPTTKGRKA